MPLSELKEWVGQIAALTKPDQIQLCDGSGNELESIKALLVRNGTIEALNQDLRALETNFLSNCVEN